LTGKALPFYASSEALREVERRFGYALLPAPEKPLYRPALIGRPVEGSFTVAGISILPFEQNHGFTMSLGFRIGPVAYSTDVTSLDETAFATLAGIELWIVDCMRREPHPTHSHVAKTLAWIDRIRPRRAILTHMDQSLDYRELCAELPPGVEPAYDGLVIDLPDT
jgi:phosphoribosyl 1,2-cyclic phosphate phosphodiesterase